MPVYGTLGTGKYLSVGRAARILGVTPKTLRDGNTEKPTNPSERRPGMAAIVLMTSCGSSPNAMSDSEPVASSARVSSATSSHDGNLDRRRDCLWEEAKKRGHAPVLMMAEQASGINDKRCGLWRVLWLAEKRGLDVLLIECPDRLPRFGYRYLTGISPGLRCAGGRWHRKCL